MARYSAETGGASCCRFRVPTIPLKWLLFIDFAFTFGTTVVYFADIVTDIITLKMYYDQGWYNPFGFSIAFIVAPSILIAILEFQFLLKMYGKNVKWGTVFLRSFLNVPFQLTVIWDHLKLSYGYFKTWLNNIRKVEKNKPIVSEERQMSVSNLADLDDRLHTTERRAITSAVVPAASDNNLTGLAYPAQGDHTWWKQLTKEQWLSHLNKMKLLESMLESLPQLLINLYLIVWYPNTSTIQYLSATLSYLSLCGGIVRFDKTRKDNEAERLMVDRTLLHSRAFATRLEWPQMLFMSLYKGCYLAARILAFVYFTVYFGWYVLILIIIHWGVLMSYLVYLWYPSDIQKKTRQLVQADYKFRAYMFLSQDIMDVFHNSLMGIFINVRPHNHAFLGQPYCFIFWFYLIYVVENVILFLLPGVVYSLRDEENFLHQHQYYVVLIVELCLNLLGSILCVIYYFSVHKMKQYTRNAYPVVSRVQGICCCDPSGRPDKHWTICKQAETSEIFYLRREKLKIYKNSYNTVVRANRKSGRNLECFIDERGKIFYARRSKLFRKIPSVEEEERVELRSGVSVASLDNLDTQPLVSKTPKQPESDHDSETIPKSKLLEQENSDLGESSEALLSRENPSSNLNAEFPQANLEDDKREDPPHLGMTTRENPVNQSSRSKRSNAEPVGPESSSDRRSQRSPASSERSSKRRSNRDTPERRSDRRSPAPSNHSSKLGRSGEGTPASQSGRRSDRSPYKDSGSPYRGSYEPRSEQRMPVSPERHNRSSSNREYSSRRHPGSHEHNRSSHRSDNSGQSHARSEPVGQTWI